MIILRKTGIRILDPAATLSGMVSQIEVFSALSDKSFDFVIPDHIVTNSDKRNYKTGFLNELYSIIFTHLKRKEIFKRVTVQNDIFIDNRMYDKYVKMYNEKKYDTFIKK